MHAQRNRNSIIAIVAVALACSLAMTSSAVETKKAEIKISLIDADGKTVKESSTGKLELDHKYEKGDRIVVTGAENMAVKVDEHYAEALLFSPKKTADFLIPLWPVGKYAKRYPHPPKAFGGAKHVITARVATDKEIGAYRNQAVNPMDPRGKSPAYPHASSASEWGEAAVFSAKTAIDGFVEATGDHHSWPRQSWGPYLPEGKHPVQELLVDFGRPVEIDKLVIVGRYNVRQGGYWKEATVEFSDGSKVTIKPEYNGDRQEFPIKKRVVTSMKFTKLVINKPRKYAAFVEVEAWGKLAPKSKKPVIV